MHHIVTNTDAVWWDVLWLVSVCMQLVMTNPESVLVTWTNRFCGVDVGIFRLYAPFFPQLHEARGYC